MDFAPQGNSSTKIHFTISEVKGVLIPSDSKARLLALSVTAWRSIWASRRGMAVQLPESLGTSLVKSPSAQEESFQTRL
jgi:hypothetical protein